MVLWRFKGTVLLLGVLMLLLLDTAMAAPPPPIGGPVRPLVAVVLVQRLAGVCSLAELFSVPHVEASTRLELDAAGGGGAGAFGPKLILLGGGGIDMLCPVTWPWEGMWESGGLPLEETTFGGPGPIPCGGIEDDVAGYFRIP